MNPEKGALYYEQQERNIQTVKAFCDTWFEPSQRCKLYQFVSDNVQTRLGIGINRLIAFASDFDLQFPKARLLDCQLFFPDGEDGAILVRVNWNYQLRERRGSRLWGFKKKSAPRRVRGAFEFLKFEVIDSKIVEITLENSSYYAVGLTSPH